MKPSKAATKDMTKAHAPRAMAALSLSVYIEPLSASGSVLISMPG